MSVFRFGLLPVLVVLTGMGCLFLAPTTATAQHHHHDHYEVPEVQKNPLAQERLSSNSEWQSYLKENSGWVARWNEVTLMPERAQGPAVSLGEIPSDDVAAERLSRRFLTSHVDAWVATEDLELVRAVEAGSGWWIQYAQQHKGLRVVDGRVFTRLTSLGSVSSFGVLTYPDVQVDVDPAVTMEAAQLTAIRDFDASTEIEAPRGELVILPQETEGKLHYILAYELRFVTYDPPGAWHAFVDGKTGSLLSIENEIKTGEVTGTLSGNVTNLRPTDALSSQPMPYASLTLKDGDTEAAIDTADATGNYSLLTDIDQDFTLTAYLDGPFGRIENDTNGDITPEMSKTVNTLGNPTEDLTFGGNSLPQDRTAYYWSMVSLDYIKNIEPDFTGLDYEMPIVTDLANQECNAFWNGIGTTFYPAGPNCANTAMIPSVVIHEYGHGVTDLQYRPFAPSGAMHEGFSDYLSATVLNDPIVGHGFFSNGDDLRRIDVNRVFPRDATGQVHNDGLIIAGALWDVRQTLG
ncbi:MAG: hypothetical protein HKN21_08455, partial [Candidatus Eisenbacteria bacterium]|nr:hypothetical protein [Candidatus Eisenbacteria bacterium]